MPHINHHKLCSKSINLKQKRTWHSQRFKMALATGVDALWSCSEESENPQGPEGSGGGGWACRALGGRSHGKRLLQSVLVELEKNMVESHPLLSGTGTWPPGGLASGPCLQYGAATAWLLTLLRVRRVQAEVLSLHKHDGCSWRVPRAGRNVCSGLAITRTLSPDVLPSCKVTLTLGKNRTFKVGLSSIYGASKIRNLEPGQ